VISRQCQDLLIRSLAVGGKAHLPRLPRNANRFVQTFADLFRYKMLYERGGWWVDLDLILLRPLTHPHPYCFATELERGTPKVSRFATRRTASPPSWRGARPR
jgi:hypothetical protein